MNATTYGLDVAKGVFQMYWIDTETAEIVNRRFRRDELIEFLAQRPAGRVALEACGSGHWWARKIKVLGHEAVLLHASFIRPFVQTNKTDAADAKAIWTAANQPEMRTVAVKTQDQQSIKGSGGAAKGCYAAPAPTGGHRPQPVVAPRPPMRPLNRNGGSGDTAPHL
jgi:transposase